MNLETFTPISGLLGGLLIGTSAALFLALNGRIAGISGVFNSLLTRSTKSTPKLWFVVGLLVAAPLWAVFGQLPPIEVNAPLWLVALGGTIVGYSTRLGSGCTSGHGVCGLSRLSTRSMVATACFMGAGVITVTCMRHAPTWLGAGL